MVNYLPRLWKDVCTIQTNQKTTKANLATGAAWVNLVTDEPCKLSFFENVRMNDTAEVKGPGPLAVAGPVAQQSKIFIRPDLTIPPGSRITVTTHKNNKILYFESSGMPSIFTNHQEIVLECVQKWA